jgi:pimeloyl-ACP methyl ester carboxylesterase
VSAAQDSHAAIDSGLKPANCGRLITDDQREGTFMARKPPLILLPGLLCDAALWQYQVSALAEFAAPQVADLTRSDSIAGMAAQVLAEAPPRFALAGLSMGGYVAQEILRQAPERVDRLALLDTSARADTPEQRERRRGLIELAQLGKFKGVTPRLLPMLLHPDHLTDPLSGIVTGMAERVGQAAFIRQELAILGRIDGRPSLSAIRLPTLVLCGEDDVLTPPEVAQEMARGIAGATLVVIEHSGHLSTLEQPEAVNRAMIEWLTE